MTKRTLREQMEALQAEVPAMREAFAAYPEILTKIDAVFDGLPELIDELEKPC